MVKPFAGVSLLVWIFLGLCAFIPRQATADAVCSSYKGQAVINELRIGSSGTSNKANQIELFNSNNLAASVWQSWKIRLSYKSVNGRRTYTRTYYLKSGFTNTGQFIFNSNKATYQINLNGRPYDVALLDKSGNFIDYVAVEGNIQAVPSCMATTVVNAAASTKKTSGNIARIPDAGSWPASVTNTIGHSIGKSNMCTASGSDLIVSNNIDNANPLLKVTPTTDTVTVSNNSCSNTVSGITLTVSGISTSNFSGLGYTRSQGPSTQGVSALVWTVGTLAPGVTATLTVTGLPQLLGTLTTVAAITTPASGLVNTGDDSDSATITVRDYNYVGFEQASDSITEGTDDSYSAVIVADNVSSKKITVNYSVSGSANNGDTDLSSSGSVVIDPNDPDSPDEATINFLIKDDAVVEPVKNIIFTITGISSTDSFDKLDSSQKSMTVTLLDDDSPPPVNIAASGFNGFDSSTAAGAVTGVIKTKVSGSAIDLDVVALDSVGSPLPKFTGDVAVELVDDASGSCSTDALIGATQTVTFDTGDLGRKSVAFMENDAWKNVRLRIKYPAANPTITACSSDNFAVRPASLAGVAKDADWGTAGTTRTLNANTTSGTPIHKAGQPFTLMATAYNTGGTLTAGYDGIPVVSLTGCTLPTSGCIEGVLSSGTFLGGGGTVTSPTASYSEVGAITAVFSDVDFAAVDANDSTLAERTVPSAAVTIGRFVPDHFDVTANVPKFSPACGSFTYLGQPFGFGTAPVLTITAKNSSGMVTQNYAATLWNMPTDGSTVTGQAWSAASGNVSAVSGILSSANVSSLGAGIGIINFSVGDPATGGGLAFQRNTTIMAPLIASLTLSANIIDSDGVSYSGNPYLLGNIGFDDGNAATGNDAQLRYGRIGLVNAYGSELVALPVSLTAQYWNGTAFVLNTSDGCTPITAPVSGAGLTFYPEVLSTILGNHLSAAETTATISATGKLTAGDGQLNFSAPGTGNDGYLDISLQVPIWLKFDWNTATVGDEPPSARATFGIYKGNNRNIFLREVY
ncbi:MAG: hypothetical protein Q8N96_13175 [Methylovulum sp.]|nr:hypothetical protein [Methylovulum sp.]